MNTKGIITKGRNWYPWKFKHIVGRPDLSYKGLPDFFNVSFILQNYKSTVGI